MVYSFRRLLNILSLLALAYSGSTRAEASAPIVHQGVLDLRNHTFLNEPSLAISGEWQVFWGRLLSPTQINQVPEPESFYSQLTYTKMETFNQLSDKDKFLSHGTYRLKILLPKVKHPLSIKFPELRNNAIIWINGKLIDEIGKPAPNPDEEVDSMKPFIYDFIPEAKSLDIIIQGSAHNNGFFGPMNHPTIGTPVAISSDWREAQIRDAFALGAIAIMGFYHLFLFLLRRDRFEPLWFGLFCLVICVRSFLRSDGHLVYSVFDSPSATLAFKVEFICFALSFTTAAQFFYVLYPKELNRKIMHFGCWIGGIYALIVAVTSHATFYLFLIPFQILVVSLMSYAVVRLIKSIMMKREGAQIFLIGLAILLGAVINDILKHSGAIRSIDLSHLGLFFFVLCQSVVLSKRFARAFFRLQDAETEIRTLNESLEHKVKERTLRIQTILDNVKSGFLMINRHLKVMDGYTASCREILSGRISHGAQFLDLFDQNDRAREQMEMALEQVFDDMLPPDVSLAQINNRKQIGDRTVSLEGSIVRSEDGHVVAILFTLTDVSKLVETELHDRLNQRLLNLVKDRPRVRTYVRDSLSKLNHCMREFDNTDEEKIRNLLHTLKGNFSAFGLDEIAAHIHDIEGQENIDKPQIKGTIRSIREFFDHYNEYLQLDLDTIKDQSYLIFNDDLCLLREKLIESGLSKESRDIIDQWYQQIQHEPVRVLIGPLEKNMASLAKSLGKEIDFKMIGADTRVDAERFKSLLNSIIHLIRNAADHGIEESDQRRDKNPIGCVTFSTRLEDGQIIFKISDDGQGLDPVSIKETALQKKLLSQKEAETATDHELFQLIFKNGFSTKQSINEISGRGIGTTAVREEVTALGGHIHIESKPGQGTSFEIFVPADSNSDSPTDLHRNAS